MKAYKPIMCLSTYGVPDGGISLFMKKSRDKKLEHAVKHTG